MDSSIWVLVGSVAGSLLTAISVVRAERIKNKGLEEQREAQAKQAIADATVSVNEAAEVMAKNVTKEMTRMQGRIDRLSLTLKKQAATISELEITNKTLQSELKKARESLSMETEEFERQLRVLNAQYESTVKFLNNRISQLEQALANREVGK